MYCNVKTFATFLIFCRRLICPEKCTFHKLTMEIICKAVCRFSDQSFVVGKKKLLHSSYSLHK